MSFDKSPQVANAWIAVEPILAAKNRGDDVTRDEVEAAGGIAARRLEHRIRRHFLRRGIDLIPLVNVGWHIPTDEEQVRDRAEHHRTRARHSVKRVLHAAGSVDETALTPQARTLRAMYVRHAALAVETDRKAGDERKAIMGAPPPPPRLPGKPE